MQKTCTQRASNQSNLAKRLNQCNRKSVMFGGGERGGGGRVWGEGKETVMIQS